MMIEASLIFLPSFLGLFFSSPFSPSEHTAELRGRTTFSFSVYPSISLYLNLSIHGWLILLVFIFLLSCMHVCESSQRMSRHTDISVCVVCRLLAFFLFSLFVLSFALLSFSFSPFRTSLQKKNCHLHFSISPRASSPSIFSGTHTGTNIYIYGWLPLHADLVYYRQRDRQIDSRQIA